MTTQNLTLRTAFPKCASCKKYLSSPPVYVQSTGDSVCEKCSNTAGPPFFRNKLYENIVKNVFFPCEFVSRGCRHMVVFGDTQQHEATCPHKHYYCPIELCVWSGSMDKCIEHFQNGSHGAVRLVGSNFVFNRDGVVFKLIKLGKRVFVLWLIARPQKIIIELINLDCGESVKYKVSIYKPNTRDTAEFRKEGVTRLFVEKLRHIVEFEKKLLDDLLGQPKMYECSLEVFV